MKRDHCTFNVANIVNDTRWARNPGKYDLVGFDDGSNCEGEVRNSRILHQAKLIRPLVKRTIKKITKRR